MSKIAITSLTALSIFIISCKEKVDNDKNQVQEIEKVMQDYRNAWKKSDSTAILSTLSNDVVLYQPTKSGKPVIGKDKLKNFWFPKSDIKYPIISYKVFNSHIEVSQKLAYYQGVSKLKWYTLENNQPKDSTTSTSEFITILKKDNHKWKIQRIMYNLKEKNYK